MRRGGHGAVGHGGVGHAGGGHFAGPGHFAGAGHVASTYRGGAYPGHGGGFAGRGGYGYPGGHFGFHGYSTGAYWRGGYWHGGFWPRAYYGAGFAWFLPILPLAYATYWYSGVPYYYANDVYYTWNPSYDGYVATDPPPVADSSGAGEGAGPAPADNGAPSANVGPGPGGPVPGQIFMYPKNGQSAEQQASDRAECQRWATDQAGRSHRMAPTTTERWLLASKDGATALASRPAKWIPSRLTSCRRPMRFVRPACWLCSM